MGPGDPMRRPIGLWRPDSRASACVGGMRQHMETRPRTQGLRRFGVQNGLTMTKITMAIISTAGISFMMRQSRLDLVLRFSAKALTAPE